jgi:glucan-binding YG repeat protein
MLKRMSTVTSLLVSAAAIISIIPANAANYKQIDTQEGTIYNAIAYKDGKFYIDGGVNNKDNAAYYLANSKYTNLSDIDSGSSVQTYGATYLNIQNGDYFINLDNGSVTNDSIKNNLQDDTALALKKNIKKDTNGRYNLTDAGTIKNLDGAELTGNKFTGLWYGVQYTANKSTNGNAASLNVYTDINGNYIDADYNIGSIKVTTNNGSTDKIVTITNTNDKYDGAGSNNTVSASVAATNSDVIGQDSNYIYRLAKITVTSSATGVSISKINGISIANQPVFNTSSTGSVSFNVIQKISKARASDNINGAKYASSVTTYIISKENGDAIDSNHALLNKYTISDGKLINYTVGSSSVKAQTILLSSKNGYYYTNINDQVSEDAEFFNNKVATDTDANGNLWALSKGSIYKWDNNNTWTKVYKVDTGFNQISVYDDNDIVTWNKANGYYSVIGGQTTTNSNTNTNTNNSNTSVLNKGWVKTNDGWTFYNASGAQIKGQWVSDSGIWYYLKANGVMATGWINDNGTWYYLASSGAMKTGWLNDNGTWYYLNASGAMLANITVDGYQLGPSGAWIK